MRQSTTAASMTRRHPLLALRLWLVWHRGLRARAEATLEKLRSGSRTVRRVRVPSGRVGLAELEFDDGRIVRLTGVHRPVAVALAVAVKDSRAELIEGAHPGPVWALYFMIGGEAAGRLAMLATTADVDPSSGDGGTRRSVSAPIQPHQLTPA